MSQLLTNDDGSVTIPLLGADPPKTVTLPEPSMLQLAQIHALIDTADKTLPSMPPTITEDSTAEEVAAATKVLRERTLATYSEDAPYGTALVAIIKLLTSEDIDPGVLPGWAANPTTCRRILGHFQTPLGG